MIFISPHDDLLHTLRFINNFSKSMGLPPISIDTMRIKGLIESAVYDGHYPEGGFGTASPFRKLAAFVAHFVANKPILYAFPESKVNKELHNIKNHQNAILALEIAIDSLHGAKIHRKDGDFTLKKRIELSNHSYFDIIDALAWVTPQDGMKMVAVLLEQMCYRQNPECEYKE